MIRFLILFLALLFGSNTIQKAKLEVEAIRIDEEQTQNLRKDLTLNDYSFMKRILDLPVSARERDHEDSTRSLIVKDGIVKGEGWNQSNLLVDPSTHAKVVAVREACKNLSTVSLKGYVLYTSAEPCPMCLSLLYVAEVDKIVYSILSKTGSSVEKLVSEKIYRALKQNKEERPIPEISFPHQMADSTIHKNMDRVSY